ncbi:MAG TPA: glycosyltransferase family 39 protein [bacterium]|jgi:hypothetical protein
MRLSNLPRPSAWPLAAQSLLVGALWILFALLVNPVGEFPVNDDWGYSKAVNSLVSGGHLQFLQGWAQTTFIAQLFWGALFALPFGFSFTALRISGLVAGFIGVVATHRTLHRYGFRTAYAWIGTLCLVLNPLYFQLCYSFMTDVPFFAASMISFVLFLRALQEDHSTSVWTGTLFAVIATLIRQVGFLVPIAWTIVRLASRPQNRREIWRAVAPTLITIGALIVFQFGIAPLIGFEMHDNARLRLMYVGIFHNVFTVALKYADNAAVAAVYLGLFLLPLALQIESTNRRRNPLHWIGLALIAAVMTALIATREHSIMPLARNMLTANSLGPLTLRDTYILGMPHAPYAPHWLWVLLTIGGVIGGASLIQHVFNHVRSSFRFRIANRANAAYMLAFGVWLMYLGLCVMSGFFDRYLLYLIPFSIILLWTPGFVPARSPALVRMATVGLLAAFALYDVGATHDYLSWNRARWDALNHLNTVQRIPPDRVDGGYEYNGWHFYSKGFTSPPGKSWWYVKDDEYVAAFGPLPGYHLQDHRLYARWLPPGTDSVLVLARDPQAPSVTALADTSQSPHL